MPPVFAGILALGLNGGAYGSEIVRGTLASFPRGQWEAAAAVNLSPFSTLLDVVLPQAIRTMLPPFGNLSIEVLKGTALVSLISVTDLTYAGYQIYSRTYRPTDVFSMTLLLYLGLALCLTLFVRALERRVLRSVDRLGPALMLWDWQFAFSILPRLLDAARVTIAATFAGFAAAMAIGLLLALRPRSGLLSWLNIGFV